MGYGYRRRYGRSGRSSTYGSGSLVRTVKYTTPGYAGVTTSASMSDADIIAWLSNYTGTDTFILDVKIRFQMYNELSVKQWQSVCDTIDRLQKALPANTMLPIYNLHTPVTLFLKRSTAFKIRDNHGLAFGVFSVRVLAINAATRGRYGIKYELLIEPDFDTPVNACRVCGKTLTDATSISTYIGPQCAKMYGGSSYKQYKIDPAKFRHDFKVECLSKMPSVINFTIYDSNINEGQSELYAAYVEYTNQTPMPVPANVNTQTVNMRQTVPTPNTPIQYNWNSTTNPMTKISDNVWILVDSSLAGTKHGTIIKIINTVSNNDKLFKVIADAGFGHVGAVLYEYDEITKIVNSRPGAMYICVTPS